MQHSIKPSKVRYLILAALAGGAILSYLLRVCISPAGTTIQKDLAISDINMGDIYSAFFLGYFWCQLPAGWVFYGPWPRLLPPIHLQAQPFIIRALR